MGLLEYVKKGCGVAMYGHLCILLKTKEEETVMRNVRGGERIEGRKGIWWQEEVER